MAKLGLEVVTMGAIGQDEIGDFLIATMQRFGVNTDSLVRKANAQTSCTMLPIRPNGERPALHVIGANGELTIDDINFDAISQAKYLHVGGAPLMRKFDGKPASQVLKFAQDHGVTPHLTFWESHSLISPRSSRFAFRTLIFLCPTLRRLK